MNTLSINIGGGVRSIQKQKWVKNLCQEHEITVLGIQETKLTQLDMFVVKAFWGNSQFGVACSSSRGRSGGILTIWDNTSFFMKRILSFENVLIVEGQRIGREANCYLINIYAPQQRLKKNRLWDYLSTYMSNNSGEFILFGDFNVVRAAHEREGSIFCPLTAGDFNNFISNSNLVEVPLCGRRFTRSNKFCNKRAKLDRLLMSNNTLDSWPNMVGRILPNLWSDHCPITLLVDKSDYGPTPFKLFNSWFNRDGFDSVVKDACIVFDNTNSLTGIHPLIRFKEKLKFIKANLKAWNHG
ncbi:uncharacterized protein [Rutidosis leptorrhynchoides]|uniref:uncharacterized protein n=1 Tax=Rutidosis leptorrhynchoides TaxID=125765 RepID=UPI003A99B84F